MLCKRGGEKKEVAVRGRSMSSRKECHVTSIQSPVEEKRSSKRAASVKELKQHKWAYDILIDVLRLRLIRASFVLTT